MKLTKASDILLEAQHELIEHGYDFGTGLSGWNDAPGRTRHQVLEMFQHAARITQSAEHITEDTKEDTGDKDNSA